MQKIQNLLVEYFGEIQAETYMANFNVENFLETKKKLEMKKMCSEYNEKNLDLAKRRAINKSFGYNDNRPIRTLAKIVQAANPGNTSIGVGTGPKDRLDLSQKRLDFTTKEVFQKKQKEIKRIAGKKRLAVTSDFINKKFSFQDSFLA